MALLLKTKTQAAANPISPKKRLFATVAMLVILALVVSQMRVDVGLHIRLTRSDHFGNSLQDGGNENTEINKFWWKDPVKKSIASGQFMVGPMPFPVNRKDHTEAILQILRYLGVVPAPTTTIIDIGLPMESLKFARNGYHVQAFEARLSGYNQVKRKIEEAHLDHLITLHQTALSNCSNQTAEIYDANDSSSLLESAVNKSRTPEVKKFERTGRRKEKVTLNRLDSFVTDAVAMKIDTQGAEREIFMGSPQLLRDNPKTGPFVIFTEFCFRFRPHNELMEGLHLLRGLGYTCYFYQSGRTDVDMLQFFNYCGDFMCIRSPKWNFTSMTV